jgi:hypothetical protein
MSVMRYFKNDIYDIYHFFKKMIPMTYIIFLKLKILKILLIMFNIILNSRKSKMPIDY